METKAGICIEKVAKQLQVLVTEIYTAMEGYARQIQYKHMKDLGLDCPKNLLSLGQQLLEKCSHLGP